MVIPLQQIAVGTDVASNNSQVTFSVVKKPYHCPTLHTYGSVSRITQGVGSFSGDGGSMRMMAATMMSDRRTKNLLARVGMHPTGFGLYLFEYKAQFAQASAPGVLFGVVAQEVARFVPAAVSVGNTGYLQVNYAQLGITFPG